MNQSLLKKALEKHSRARELHFTADDIRWATPEIVAQHRAHRLACKSIADLGSGIGFQTFAFAKTCTKVYAVEIDKEKLRRAEQNAKILGLKNITFLHGDALDPKIIAKLKDVEVVFCDPSRLPEEKERSIGTITPNIQQLLEEYSSLTQNIALEFPPQIQTIPFDCEREYLSWHGRLNRLTLYFGTLKQHDRSVVILPHEEILTPNNRAKLVDAREVGNYIYEIDPAITKAQLLPELSMKTKTASLLQGKITLFTSPKLVESVFFVRAFTVLDSCSSEEKVLLNRLKQHQVGKVVLRFTVDPKDYWNVRKKYESQLSGKKEVHLFEVRKQRILAEEVRR